MEGHSLEPDSSGRSARLLAQIEGSGETVSLDLNLGAVKGSDVKKIRVPPDGHGLLFYDPGFANTAACKSAITYIDGEAGILEYRGYPIAELAQAKSYLEVAYLIIQGELPKQDELHAWEAELRDDLKLPTAVGRVIAAFPKGSHPMTILCSATAALAADMPEVRQAHDSQSILRFGTRLIALMPLIAAASINQSSGGAVQAAPPKDLDYVDRFLWLCFSAGDANWRPHDALAHAIDLLFTLHADHEQNCSTSVLRSVSSSGADMYSAAAGAVAALSGPLHGGANEAAIRMLHQIQSKDGIGPYLKEVESKRKLLYGFGHPVYRSYDPRARVIKDAAHRVFEVTGVNPLLEIALELERSALEDAYFVDRHLYPNVDFYSGLIYEAMGFPISAFTVLFALARTVGWVAHLLEEHEDPESKIARPRQLYVGRRERHLNS